MADISLADLTKAKQVQTDLAPISTQEQLENIKNEVEELSPEARKKVDEIKNSIDLMDSQSAVQFGVGAQRNISSFADTILMQVKSKDTGYVGDIMTDLVLKVKGLEINKLGGSEGFLSKIPFFKSLSDSFARFTQHYVAIESQIDRIEAELDKARMQLLKDIGMFDTLYEKNLEYFQELQIYIRAGEEKIEELKNSTLPKLREEANASKDTMAAQVVNDFEETVNRFEKKIYDIKLSKTIAIQAAPQIKLIQNNDKLLVDKIQMAILNTIPLWKSQIVIAIGMYRQNDALKLQREVSDTTNELLTKNSEMLKTNTLEVAKESERGIVDIETLKKVNENLISTIEETIQIQKEGHEKRKSAEIELVTIEENLKQTLLKVHQGNP